MTSSMCTTPYWCHAISLLVCHLQIPPPQIQRSLTSLIEIMATRRIVFTKYTTRSAETAEAPRTLRELNALRALGSILDKRDWWVKWTTRPDVRAKWMKEIDSVLIRTNVTQGLKFWPAKPRVDDYGYSVEESPERLVMQALEEVWAPFVTACNLEDEEKEREVQRLTEHVYYPTPQLEWDPLSDGETYESSNIHDEIDHTADDVEEKRREIGSSHSDEDDDNENNDDDEDDEDDDSNAFSVKAIESNFPKVYRCHTRKHPFCQIVWFLNMKSLHERLGGMTVDDWTPETLLSILRQISFPDRNAALVEQAISLIESVMNIEGEITVDDVATRLPAGLRPNVVKLLRLHFLKIRLLLDKTKEEIAKALDVTIDRLGLNAETPLPGNGARPGPVPQVWLSETAVPADVKAKFVREVAELESVPEEEKDYHPNTNKQVLNLVHPSMYCGVGHRTRLLPASARDEKFSSPAEQMRAIMFRSTESLLTCRYSSYQWLPSEVDVPESGEEATFRSYINNLHPVKHASLYGSIESIFARFVPLFDRVLSTLPTQEVTGDEDISGRSQWYSTYDSNYRRHTGPRNDDLTPPGVIQTDNAGDIEIGRFSLKGSRCQVIVKIAEIQLTADKPTYNGGSWHVEGTDTERIIATGLYYFGSENITESRLSFRLWVSPPYYEQNDNVGVGLTYGLHDGDVLAQQYTSMTAMEDRCVVFPNIYQHKVEPFELADKSKSGVRKILAFFLVDPTHGPIASTAVVPPQQQTWIDQAREPEMKRMRLPDVVVNRIQDISGEGMSLEEALQNRLMLMKERTPHDDKDDRRNENHFTLCEH